MAIHNINIALDEQEYRDLLNTKKRAKKTWKEFMIAGSKCMEKEIYR